MKLARVPYGTQAGKTFVAATKTWQGKLELGLMAKYSKDPWVREASQQALAGKKPTESVVKDVRSKLSPVKLSLIDPYTIGIESTYEWKDYIKTIPGRRWRGQLRQWHIPLQSLSKARSIMGVQNLIVDPRVTEAWGKMIDPEPLGLQPQKVGGLGGTLFPYQEKDVAFIEHTKGRTILGHEMGLGKSVMALAWLHLHPELRPVVIVAPATVKINWLRHIKRWLPGDPSVEVIQGRYGNGNVPTGLAQFYIINWAILASGWDEWLISKRPAVIILDECHRAKRLGVKPKKGQKDKRVQRTVSAMKMAHAVRHVLLLTGSPMLNRPIELWTLLNMINKKEWASYWEFAAAYCDSHETRFGWDVSGSSNEEELRGRLRGVMVRRLKKDHRGDLPGVTHQPVWVELSNRREYVSAVIDIVAWAKQNRKESEMAKSGTDEGGQSALAKLTYLRQIVARGKLRGIFEWVDNFFEETDEKLVVFAHHREIVDAIVERYREQVKTVRLVGGDSEKSRWAAIDAFQNDLETKLFVGNILAAGEGIDLFAGCYTLFVELPWSPERIRQAESRLDRTGQMRPVTAYFALGQDTVDEMVTELIDWKEQVANIVTGDDRPRLFAGTPVLLGDVPVPNGARDFDIAGEVFRRLTEKENG